MGDVPTYNVYVIELDDSLREGEKPAVYVGETSRTPEERFEQHKSGYKSSKWVRRYAVRLRPRLYRSYNPISTRDEAKALEKRLGKKLESRGYTVFGAR
jgi:predicted GIY-YIG superfamily endonuclease